MRIAVTAASGRLGHAVLRALRAAPAEAGGIVAVARRPERVEVEGIEKRPGDYGSIASMTAALAGVGTVLMISAPVVAASDRVQLHRNVLAAARAAGVGRVLFTSVVGKGGAENTLFAATQQINRQTEADVRDSGLDWTILRNGLYLELDLAHIVAAGPDGVYANPGGDGRAPYVTIAELAHATARAATRADLGGRTCNLVGECLTQAELVTLANEVFDLRVRYETQSDEACIEKFRRLYPQRGDDVARMLTGCFQCIRAGLFDVASDYEAVAGRPPKTVRQMMEDVRRKTAPS